MGHLLLFHLTGLVSSRTANEPNSETCSAAADFGFASSRESMNSHLSAGGKKSKCTRNLKEHCKKKSPKKRGTHMRFSVYEIIKQLPNVYSGPQAVHGIPTFVTGQYLNICCTGLF